MRKTDLLMISITILLLLVVPTLADFDHGCCITPVELAPNGLSLTKETCTAPNLWVENCYDADLLDAQQEPRNLSLFTTNCCCLGNDVGFETEATNIGKTPADVFEVYCKAQPNYRVQNPVGNDCEAACASNLFTTKPVFVEGLVTNQLNNKGISDVRVILEYDDKSKFNTTTENGYYNFSNIKQGYGWLTFVLPPNYPLNCNAVEPRRVTIDGNKSFTDSFSCSQTSGGCEPIWDDQGWGDCIAYGGSLIQQRTVVDNNNCGLSPGDFFEMTRFCDGTPESGVCGDGVLNTGLGEQCDVSEEGKYFLATDGSILSGDVTCEDVLGTQYGGGDIGCTDFCTFDLSQCNPGCVGDCDTTLKCGCDICQQTDIGRKICSQECKTLTPNFIPATEGLDSRNLYDLYAAFGEDDISTNLFPGLLYELGSRDVNLSWTYETTCNDYLLGFKLEVCQEQGTDRSCRQGTKQAVMIRSPTARLGSIENALKEPHTSYCYNVCAVTEDGEKHCAYEDGNLPCFMSGDAICMRSTREKGYNCERIGGSVNPVGCNIGGENGEFEPFTNLSLEVINCNKDEGAQEICVETEEKPGAACRSVAPCERCNGLFGLYANYNLDVVIDEQKFSCDELQFYGVANPSNRFLSSRAKDVVGLCFKDETLTTQPAFDSCEKVNTCYAYKSKDACLNDPCMRFQDASRACEWTAFDEELGIGVCGPVIADNVECGRCDTDSPLGFCTKELCQEVYGKGDAICYYNEQELSVDEQEQKDILFREQQNPILPTCVHKKNMGCYFYDNQADCEGGQTATYNISYDVAESVSVDTLEAKPTSGSNEQITSSLDYFGFGNCYWDTTQNVCLKNANGMLFHKANKPAQDDCLETIPKSDDLLCFTDSQPPTTTILWKDGIEPVYGITELASLPIEVTDDKQNQKNIQTYFSIVPSTSPAQYPTHLLSEFVDVKNGILSTLTDGEYVIRYFSMDVAKNLEPIQEKTIRIDATSPNVLVNYVVVPQELGPDSFVSDLIVNVGGLGEPAHCKIALYDATNSLAQPANDKEYLETTGFATRYVNLRDGLYTIGGFCSDLYGNENVIDVPVRVDGDTSVTNPYPVGQVFKSGYPSVEADLDRLVFKIETANPATCYVSATQFDSGIQGFEMTSDETGLHHSIPYADVSTTSTSGTYSYFVKCVFKDRVVQNDPADSISFSIDNESPLAVLRKRVDGAFKPYIELGENWEEAKYFQIGCDDSNSKTAFNYAGCRSITYCLGDERIEGLSPAELENYCDTRQYQGASVDINIKGTEEDLRTYGKKFLYYYATDAFGNQETEAHVAELRIRNTNFDKPTFIIQ